MAKLNIYIYYMIFHQPRFCWRKFLFLSYLLGWGRVVWRRYNWPGGVQDHRESYRIMSPRKGAPLYLRKVSSWEALQHLQNGFVEQQQQQQQHQQQQQQQQQPKLKHNKTQIPTQNASLPLTYHQIFCTPSTFRCFTNAKFPWYKHPQGT